MSDIVNFDFCREWKKKKKRPRLENGACGERRIGRYLERHERHCGATEDDRRLS